MARVAYAHIHNRVGVSLDSLGRVVGFNKGVFSTSDVEVQKALEAHPQFGKDFTIVDADNYAKVRESRTDVRYATGPAQTMTQREREIEHKEVETPDSETKITKLAKRKRRK